ncbi:hypothetical protein V8C34DRAFT_327504 [Trichoderma compactum]
MMEGLVERYNKAMDQARLLVQVEQRKQPYTLNKQFAQALSKARGYRVSELLLPKARKHTKQFGGTRYMIHCTALLRLSKSKAMRSSRKKKFMISFMLDTAWRLTGSSTMSFSLLLTMACWRGPCIPLKVFTKDWVINLEAGRLEQIVGETRNATRRRQGYAKKIVGLTNALKILRTWLQIAGLEDMSGNNPLFHSRMGSTWGMSCQLVMLPPDQRHHIRDERQNKRLEISLFQDGFSYVALNR